MIALSILKELAANGFGTIDTDLFYEEVPIDAKGKSKDGVWIVSRGSPVNRFGVGLQNFDIYSRYSNKLTGDVKLDNILHFLQESYSDYCELEADEELQLPNYLKVRITPTSSVENVGTDENNKVVRVISGSVQYERNQ